MRVVVISGLSGAGKSCAARTLEDLGFYCIDNLPVFLLHPFLDLTGHSGETVSKLALVIDARDKKHIGKLPDVLRTMRKEGGALELVFLEASDEALSRRFSETRHRHPLAEKGETALDGIGRERILLAPVRDMAEHVIDTSELNVKELRQRLLPLFASPKERPSMTVEVVSFGFKFGLPPQADMVLDVRFLPNPYFREELKRLPGTDPKVVEYLTAREETAELLAEYERLLGFLMPRFDREGKSYFHLGVGCTGGRHRSVVVADRMARVIEGMGYPVSLVHRDLGRENP